MHDSITCVFFGYAMQFSSILTLPFYDAFNSFEPQRLTQLHACVCHILPKKAK